MVDGDFVFLGLIGYYRRFIRAYAFLATSLTNLLKKNSLIWNIEIKDAFTKLKFATTLAPVLAFPDFKQPFIIETNASSAEERVMLSNMATLLHISKKKLVVPKMQR
uniref:Reverse transcriptase/retrotransposon-derived protein RNase H-like domain-containing protein n=1 Tax=Cajanus cajan TaxID=3821 RepID=A0A151SF94_CAJCA|nr:hypothetical protein KK1_024576 [Cajanus cajan]